MAPPQSEVELQFYDDRQIAHALRCQNAADECSSAVTPRSRMRHKSREVLHSPRYHHDRVKRRRRRGDARRMSLLFAIDFQKRSATPTSKNRPERSRCCLIFASREQRQPQRMVSSGGYPQPLHRHQDAPMANDEHVAMLKQGVAAWNAWRRENPTSVRTSAERTSARRTSAGRTSTGRTSLRRTSSARTSARRTSAGRTSWGCGARLERKE